MSWKQNDEYYEQARELRAELARDKQLAMDAASRIGNGTAIERIETEALDALETWIGFELQDRARRCNPQQHLIDEANPF